MKFNFKNQIIIEYHYSHLMSYRNSHKFLQVPIRASYFIIFIVRLKILMGKTIRVNILWENPLELNSYNLLWLPCGKAYGTAYGEAYGTAYGEIYKKIKKPISDYKRL